VTQRVVAEVMTRAVATATASTPQPDIVAVLARLGIGGIPVVDDSGRPLGVVSEEDVFGRRGGVSAGHGGVWLDWMPSPEQRPLAGTVAAQLMSAPPPTVTPQTSLPEAARLLLTSGRRRLLVIDAAGRLIGIVTRSDLLRALMAPDSVAGRQEGALDCHGAEDRGEAGLAGASPASRRNRS
jgi:CBS domain-containing protein